MQKDEHYDEIDLIYLSKKLWENNLKIFTSISISLLGTFIVLLINPLKTNVSIPFSSLSDSEELKYAFLNSALSSQLGAQLSEDSTLVNKEVLNSLYIYNLKKAAGEVLEEYDLITKESFKTNREFNLILEEIFRINGPFEPKQDLSEHYIMNLKLDNINLWEEIIKKIDEKANESARVVFKELFENLISNIEEELKILENTIADKKDFKELNSNFIFNNNYFETLSRANKLKNYYESSPLNNKNEFRATELKLLDASFNNYQNLIYLLVLFISFSSSSIYILKFVNNKD